MSTPATLDTALHWAALGVSVFPVSPDSKKPRIRGWQKLATTDPNRIREWWAKWPDSNLGLTTGGGLMGLDYDPRNDDGGKSLERLGTILAEMHYHPWAMTGSGGEHLYFEGDGPTRVGWMPGVDLKGRGGYLVSPPSQFPSGAPYTMMVDPADVPMPEWPEVFPGPESLKDPRKAKTRLPEDRVLVPGGEIPEGHRHSELVRRGGQLRHHGAGLDELLVELASMNDQRCSPPLDPGEVVSIAEWLASQASFGEAYWSLFQEWARPVAGRKGASRYRIRQALLTVAWESQAMTPAPGVRRLVELSALAKQTVVNALEDMQFDGEISGVATPYGHPTAYRLNQRMGEDPKVEDMSWSSVLTRFAERLAFKGKETALFVSRTLDPFEGKTTSEVSEAVKVSKRTAAAHLRWLESVSRVRRTGRGVRSDPALWFLVPMETEMPAWGQWSEYLKWLGDLAHERGSVAAWLKKMRQHRDQQRRYKAWHLDAFKRPQGTKVDFQTGEILEAWG